MSFVLPKSSIDVPALADAAAPPPGCDAHRAIAVLYRQYVDDVDRWVRRLAGPGHDAADIIHDVFMVAMAQWDGFRGDSTPRTWLFGIAQKVVATRRRKERVRKWLMWRNQSLEPTIDTHDGLVELERQRRCAILYSALNRLADKYRTPLVLYELENHTGHEIASMLGVEVNAVWVRLHRGRALLRKALKEVAS